MEQSKGRGKLQKVKATPVNRGGHICDEQIREGMNGLVRSR